MAKYEIELDALNFSEKSQNILQNKTSNPPLAQKLLAPLPLEHFFHWLSGQIGLILSQFPWLIAILRPIGTFLSPIMNHLGWILGAASLVVEIGLISFSLIYNRDPNLSLWAQFKSRFSERSNNIAQSVVWTTLAIFIILNPPLLVTLVAVGIGVTTCIGIAPRIKRLFTDSDLTGKQRAWLTANIASYVLLGAITVALLLTPASPAVLAAFVGIALLHGLTEKGLSLSLAGQDFWPWFKACGRQLIEGIKNNKVAMLKTLNITAAIVAIVLAPVSITITVLVAASVDWAATLAQNVHQLFKNFINREQCENYGKKQALLLTHSVTKTLFAASIVLCLFTPFSPFVAFGLLAGAAVLHFVANKQLNGSNTPEAAPKLKESVFSIMHSHADSPEHAQTYKHARNIVLSRAAMATGTALAIGALVGIGIGLGFATFGLGTVVAAGIGIAVLGYTSHKYQMQALQKENPDLFTSEETPVRVQRAASDSQIPDVTTCYDCVEANRPIAAQDLAQGPRETILPYYCTKHQPQENSAAQLEHPSPTAIRESSQPLLRPN